MKKVKIIILLLIIVIGAVGCNKKPVETPTAEEIIQEKIGKLEAIDIKNTALSKETESPFIIPLISVRNTPALTYYQGVLPEKDSKEESKITDKVNINVANIFHIRLSYNKTLDETIKSVKISNVKSNILPKKGTLKYYAINNGDDFTYLDKMREHEIKNEYVYEKDLYGAKLEDGFMDLMFSASIENITNDDIENLSKGSFKTVLNDKKILNSDLIFNITFTIQVNTDNKTYAKTFTYLSNELDILKDINQKVYNYENVIYLTEIK